MFFKTEKLTFYFEKYGDSKQTILIFPGWGNTRNTFLNIINAFKDNYTIYILDYPGFGNSPIPNCELTIYDYADAIYNFLCEYHIDNPIIFAHSFGGRITAIIVGKYSYTVKKILLIDVAGIRRRKSLLLYLKEKLYKLLKLGRFLLPKVRRNTYLQKLLGIFGSSDYNNIPSCFRRTFQNIVNEDLREYYKKINSDVLIIWGDKDFDTPLKDGLYLKKIIKNAEIIVYKNANHFSYLNYSILTINIIKEFVK